MDLLLQSARLIAFFLSSARAAFNIVANAIKSRSPSRTDIMLIAVPVVGVNGLAPCAVMAAGQLSSGEFSMVNRVPAPLVGGARYA